MADHKVSFLSDPTLEQLQAIVALYRQAGWWPEVEADYARLAQLVRQSHCFAIAEAGGELIGMGRAISDGVSDAYIQDVTVTAAWRRLGIGSRLVQQIVHRLHADGITWIGLVAERGSAPFYRQFGFAEMGNSQPMLLVL